MKLEFRKLRRDDAYKFIRWGKHEDPRFYQYNFPFDHKGEFDAWYFSKQKLIRKKVYGLFLADYPLGFITLKHIKWFQRKAELGIAIDPNYISEGFGSELLRQYLNYVFGHYPIDTMSLRVAHFNKRAQKSYEKIGFIKIKEIFEPFEEQGFKDVIMTKYPDQFSMIDGTLYTTFYVMEFHKNQMIKVN
ncbi:GNAT family N-acetyltransferase [Fusibacter bizertensis]|uniref:GNAT family N-acetyltransferase n=1 Tax=Fusibacter bizertensis TaxID=1488331 RepID=A0ABT6NFL4_9FIRM|nr:GNAT family N-acetyltransferase [Fusibacter bizertensis]MDH8679221.1 GNAT family N-acetyltransferase [Fusibacter bizertensis]